MAMEEYPKIETLYDRNPENMKHILWDQYRLPEFSLVNQWLVTEKIDGTNVRVHFDAGDRVVRIGGRTDAAQMPLELYQVIDDMFPIGLFEAAFDDDVTEVTLYGEGYGPKIQSGGWYRDTPGFRLFDVKVGEWWLNWDSVVDVAEKMNVSTVPCLARRATTHGALTLVKSLSVTAGLESGKTERRMHEGIVCRTDPLLFTRQGKRLMWKLKGRDLP